MAVVINGTTGVSGVDGSAGTPSYQGTDSNTGIFFPAADTIAFAEGGAEAMRIDSSGNVGIGTSSPTSKLQVWQTGAVTSVKIDGIENPIEAARYAANADGSVIFLLKSRNATVGSHTILQNGDQIGVLQARGSNGTSFVDAASIVFAVDGTPGAGNDMPGRIVFNTSPDGTASLTERMRIDSSGNVGIGVTPFANSLNNGALDLKSGAGVFGFNNRAFFTGNAYYSTSWKYKATSGATVINTETDGQLTIGCAASGTVDTAISFTNVVQVNVGKSLALQGATPQSGTGITFPATQSASTNANTLDDYEEGTWTPNVIHSSSNNSTWTTKNGYYTKVGRLVTAWFVCDGGNSGTSGSTLQVTGLPFALGTISGAVTWGIWSTNGTVRNGGFVQSSSGSTTMDMYNGGGTISEQQTYGSGCITYFV